MKICLIAEGSYPYVTGGVSSWIQMLTKNINEHNFIIYAIGAEKKYKDKYSYTLPDNILGVKEVFLDSILEKSGIYGSKYWLDKETRENLKRLITGEEVKWELIFELVKKRKIRNALDFFMSIDFFDIIKEAYIEKFSVNPFTEFFWTIRSMLVPLFFLFENPLPDADVYHSVSNGYAGILGTLAKYIHKIPFILTEHGIYSREREEEIIKSSWIKGIYKNMWIKFFYNISNGVYESTDRVFSLFNKNKEIALELGCDSKKIEVIPNGVDVKELSNLQSKTAAEEEYINIGTVTRVVPIKDIKTMIQSFNMVKKEIKNTRLYIMGPTDESKEYFKECKQLVERLKLEDVYFMGKVNIKDHIGKMDIIILTSISEGQPLSILEGMASGKPTIATDVGCCRELLYGTHDKYGQAGIITPIMNLEKISEAIIRLCNSKQLREEMGKNGFDRVSNLYTFDKFIGSYRNIYKEFEK